jgi:hypothetical protein
MCLFGLLGVVFTKMRLSCAMRKGAAAQGLPRRDTGCGWFWG